MFQADIPTGPGLPIKRKLLDLYNIYQELSEGKANNKRQKQWNLKAKKTKTTKEHNQPLDNYK